MLAARILAGRRAGARAPLAPGAGDRGAAAGNPPRDPCAIDGPRSRCAAALRGPGDRHAGAASTGCCARRTALPGALRGPELGRAHIEAALAVAAGLADAGGRPCARRRSHARARSSCRSPGSRSCSRSRPLSWGAPKRFCRRCPRWVARRLRWAAMTSAAPAPRHTSETRVGGIHGALHTRRPRHGRHRRRHRRLRAPGAGGEDRRPPGTPLRRGGTRSARGTAGDRRGRQGLHRRARVPRHQPAGRARVHVQGALQRGARARLPVARTPAHAAATG